VAKLTERIERREFLRSFAAARRRYSIRAEQATVSLEPMWRPSDKTRSARRWRREPVAPPSPRRGDDQ